jgi:hypothetical protein
MADSLKKFLSSKNKVEVVTPEVAVTNDEVIAPKAIDLKAIDPITLPDNLPGCDFICANNDGTVQTFDLISNMNTNITNAVNNQLIPEIMNEFGSCCNSADWSALEAAVTANTNAIIAINTTLNLMAGQIAELQECCEQGGNCSYDVVIPQQTISFNIPGFTAHTSNEQCLGLDL